MTVDETDPQTTKVFSTALGHDLVFVNREQLRRKGGRMMCVPSAQSLLDAPLPTPPAVIDWTKGNTAKLPILGNDRYGDCYMAAPLHMFQCWAWVNGITLTFDASAVVKRYLQLSPRDQGLGDEQVFPEMKAGMIGPNGPNKIFDDLIIDPNNDALIALSIWRFGGVLYTASLSQSWLNPSPGAVWDVGHPNPNYGHAMYLSGKGKYYDVQTWGLNPPVELTPAGLKSSDPEIIVCAGFGWYDPKTGMSQAGFHYTEDADLWVQLGGHPFPASPFPPKPVPVPPPVPPPVVPPVPPVPPSPPAPPLTVPFSITFAVDPTTATITVTPPAGYGVAVNSEPPAVES